jgi:hypothetical protein
MGFIDKIKGLLGGATSKAGDLAKKAGVDDDIAKFAGSAKNVAGDALNKAKSLADTDNDGKLGMGDLKGAANSAQKLASQGTNQARGVFGKLKKKI